MSSHPIRSGKFGGWILFFASLLLLSFGATPYHKIADTALIATRISILLILSILIVRERWGHRHDLAGGRTGPSNRGERVLERVRRWYYDEPAGNQQIK
jgi:hypothetical protein